MTGKNATRAVRAAERAARALELRKAGATYDQIARQLGYRTPAGAFHAVRRTLERMLREPAEDVRALELERLDALQINLWSRAVRGDDHAIDRLLRIMERRARLLGLDAAQREEHDIGEVLAGYLARIAEGDDAPGA